MSVLVTITLISPDFETSLSSWLRVSFPALPYSPCQALLAVKCGNEISKLGRSLAHWLRKQI